MYSSKLVRRAQPLRSSLLNNIRKLNPLPARMHSMQRQRHHDNVGDKDYGHRFYNYTSGRWL